MIEYSFDRDLHRRISRFLDRYKAKDVEAVPYWIQEHLKEFTLNLYEIENEGAVLVCDNEQSDYLYIALLGFAPGSQTYSGLKRRLDTLKEQAERKAAEAIP